MADAFTPEVVLLDIGMPGMDGYEVARKLRSHPDHAQALLIALTGWSYEQDQARSRAAGFDHHLRKPADIDQLIGLLASIQPARRSRGLPSRATASPETAQALPRLANHSTASR